MHEIFDSLVTALRAELVEFGALLLLFDQQQACIVRHDSDGFLAINTDVEEQFTTLARQRIAREGLMSDLASRLELPAGATLAELLSGCPEPRRPLLRALMDEINSLLERTRRRAHQNRMLLARCVETAREVLAVVRPEAFQRTYSPRGEVSAISGGNNLQAAIA